MPRWKSPHEVLSALVEYVPTFHAPVMTVAAILPDETRAHFIGRGRFLSFLRRYPFFFDLRVLDGGVRVDVRLRDDVSHPQRGAADAKFMIIDVGELTNYVARPEFIVSTESIEQGSQSVNVLPPSAPPAVRVQLEERVPVLERLCAIVPVEFAEMAALEEDLPEDILFHPYFDCQGGLTSIAGKFPQHFQVVEGSVRLRPPHLAPLALNDFSLYDSPLPDVAALVKRVVCSSDIPHWVSLTFLYEQLTTEQKQAVKRGHRSFAGFLRAHGRSVSVAQDMLQVSLWIPPVREAQRTLNITTTAPTEAETTRHCAATTTTTTSNPGVRFSYTQTQVVNELFDRFPPHRTLSLTEAVALLPRDMAATSLPRRVLGWLAAHPQYFTVEVSAEADPDRARIRRASDRQPLDLALAIYSVFPADGRSGGGGGGEPVVTSVSVSSDGEAAACEVHAALTPRQRAVVLNLGWHALATNMLPQWIALRDTSSVASASGPGAKAPPTLRVRRLQTLAALEEAIRSEVSKRGD